MLQNKSVTDLIGNVNDCPLEEQFFNPDNLAEILEHEKYHHSLKGCNIEMRINDTHYLNSKICVNKFCKTHQVNCSKTGWEIGYYQGTQSKGLMRVHHCQMCGKIIMSYQPRVYFCRDCHQQIHKRQESERRKLSYN